MTATQSFITSLRNEVIAFGVFLGVWGVAAMFYPAYVIPSPLAVISGYPGYLPENLWGHLGVTCLRIAVGFGISFVAGSLLGVLGFMLKWEAPVNAFMSSMNVLPGMVLGVIFLLVFGIGSQTPIALVAFMTLPTMTINTVNGLARRDVLLEEYLTSIGAKWNHTIQMLYLPALAPTLVSNLSIGMGLAVKVVVMGEFIGSQDGIGYLLNTARIFFNMKEVFFYLVVLLLMTLLFQAALTLLSSTVLRKYFYSS